MHNDRIRRLGIQYWQVAIIPEEGVCSVIIDLLLFLIVLPHGSFGQPRFLSS